MLHTIVSNSFSNSKNVIYDFVEKVKISNGYEPFEYEVIRKNNHSKNYPAKTRKRREADVTELPVHRGRLKIIEGIEWHEELLDVNSMHTSFYTYQIQIVVGCEVAS
jgi:hypothetical protein